MPDKVFLSSLCYIESLQRLTKSYKVIWTQKYSFFPVKLEYVVAFLASVLNFTNVMNYVVCSVELRQLDWCLHAHLVCAENLTLETSLLDQLNVVVVSPCLSAW